MGGREEVEEEERGGEDVEGRGYLLLGLVMIKNKKTKKQKQNKTKQKNSNLVGNFLNHSKNMVKF